MSRGGARAAKREADALRQVPGDHHEHGCPLRPEQVAATPVSDRGEYRCVCGKRAANKGPGGKLRSLGDFPVEW